jgi:hypothetical protein
MLVLHGLWVAGAVTVWAENARAAASARPRRGGRPPRRRPHPFAARPADLQTALPHLEPQAKDAALEVRLLLPTRHGSPDPSPELPVETETRPRSATVAEGFWWVPALRLDPGTALATLADGETGDVVAGASWRHLQELVRFATDLTARGRVLPTVVPLDGGGAAARWRPVLTGSDAAWARALTLATPPMLAAATPDDDTPASAPRDVVIAVLDTFVDAVARQRLGSMPNNDRERTPAGDGRRRGHREGTAPARGAAATANAWQRALLDAEAEFPATTAEVTRLAADLATWQRDALGRAVRARFRLVEPPEAIEPVMASEPPETWRLEFALQVAREPSVVVEADRVWAMEPDSDALRRYVDAPREVLLAELGRAQRLVPEFASALRTARPTALELDAEGAHRFLREDAATLAAAGFAVEMPGWWGRPAARLGARLRAETPPQPGLVAGPAAIGQAAIVDYRWQVALGDDILTMEELVVLARLQQPLVRLRGQWVEVDARGLQRALTAMRRDGDGQMTVAELFTALATGEAGLGGLPVLDVDAGGWLGDLLSGAAEQRLQPVPAPPEFTGVLRPYQERGLAWLAFLDSLGLGAVLADDMGLGKTVQLLALIARDRTSNAGGTPTTAPAATPTLLVCPMSLVGNWQREAARFVPDLQVHVHHGTDRAKGEAFAEAVASSDLVVTTYAVAARDAAELGTVSWRRIVLDEAQAIKNAATRQAQAVRGIPATHRVAVTGTPVENRLADLWSIMEFANPGLLGGVTRFKKRFAIPIERHGDDAMAAQLRQLTQPFVLRRVKTDQSIISDLPDKLEMEVLCSLTAEQAALYRAVVDDMLEQIDSSEGMERRGLVLATMTKLKQVCNHPAQLLRDGSRLAGRSGKLARVEETLEEVLAAGEKALLFTQFAEFGGMLRAHLSARFGREVPFLHGGVPKAERDELVQRFSASDAGSPALFVLSLKAGGTGLNLTAANHVLHVDRWWNPAVEDQATDRAFRIGQTRAVQVRKLVCAGTIEERISTMISEKRGLAARIVGTGEGWLTELSTEQLRDLVRLEESAVVE